MPASKIKEKFGNRMRQLRREQDLTQEKLADLTKLHYTYIGVVEQGEKNISLENIEKIVKALKISLAEFFAPFK